MSSLLIIWLSVFSFSYADTSRAKNGFDFRAIKTNLSQDFGWLAGAHSAFYFGTSNVYMGLKANFGGPLGTNPAEDHMYYGGVVLGAEGAFSKKIFWELQFLGGYGQGRFKHSNLTETSYLVFEPSWSIGVPLGKGWRARLTASYVYMAHGDHFSGGTFGVCFEHKSVASPLKDVVE